MLSSSYLGEKGESEDTCEGDNQQYLVCIARRIPTNEPQGTPVEQFTTKLDNHGHILDIDISGISSSYSQYLTKVRSPAVLATSFLYNVCVINEK